MSAADLCEALNMAITEQDAPALTAPLTYPAWLLNLLQAGAQHMAARGVFRTDFVFMPGTPEQDTYTASLRLDPVTAHATAYVHHAASGEFVCRSVGVCVDEIDAGNWCTDFAC